MNTTETRILLVDDHSLMLEGLRHVLQRQPGMTVVGEATNGQSAIEQVQTLSPQIVIMDLHLGREHGLPIIRRILADFPDVRIIVLSADSSLPVVTEALQAGVAGYVIKDNDSTELIRAIRAVMDHRTFFCQEASSVVMGDYLKVLASKTMEPSKPLLTDGELRLLRLIADGKRNKEIAVVLGVSVKSVETYRPRLMKKLGCSSSSELTRYAIREGIVAL